MTDTRNVKGPIEAITRTEVEVAMGQSHQMALAFFTEDFDRLNVAFPPTEVAMRDVRRRILSTLPQSVREGR